MDDTKNKNIVKYYNSKGILKSIKTFNTLDECFNYIFSKQKKNEKSFSQLKLF